MPLSDFENLDLSSGIDTEDLFASPSATPSKSKANAKAAPKQQDEETVNPTTRPFPETRYDAEQAREESLRRELEGVRNINEVIEGVISSLETAKGNMANVSRTVTLATTLLNTWTQILSQTEHNQRLILNPNWQGASQDVADIENEAELRAQVAERRAQEEERLREAARRRAEDEERERQAGTTVRGSRGRGRGLARGGSKYGINAGYVAVGGQGGVGRGSTSTSRGSAIGRGVGTTRGRARSAR